MMLYRKFHQSRNKQTAAKICPSPHALKILNIFVDIYKLINLFKLHFLDFSTTFNLIMLFSMLHGIVILSFLSDSQIPRLPVFFANVKECVQSNSFPASILNCQLLPIYK